MALKPTQRWLDSARAGTAEPVLLFELRPTVLYDEKNFAGDWRAGRDTNGRLLSDPANVSNLSTLPPEGVSEPYPDELRLARREVEHPEKQPLSRPMDSGQAFRHFGLYESAGVDTYKDVGQYIQTFRSPNAFRLSKLKLGLYNHSAAYKGRLRIKLYSHLSESALSDFRWTVEKQPFGKLSVPATSGIYNGAKLVHSFEYSASRDSLSGADSQKAQEGVDYESVDGNTFKIFDLSAANVWLPGGDIPCAIDLSVDSDDHAGDMQLLGSGDDNAYGRGQLLQHDHGTGKSFKVPGDMGFKFVAAGYADSGTGVWTLDLGAKPAADLEGELELCYCRPPGTGLKFELRESDSGSGWPSAWRTVSDGAALDGKRYIQVRVTLSSGGAHGLDSPRVYSVRASYKRAYRFVMASRPLFGYPNLVAEAPDYSAEGDVLSGRASSSDTSRIVLLSAGEMLARLFSLYDLKNDEVRAYLGFDAPGFLDTSPRDYNGGRGDWLPFKTLWIEDWELGEAVVILSCYDQLVRFLQSESPAPGGQDQPAEQVHYDLLTPAAIKLDLLQRARIRPSRIDYLDRGDGLPHSACSFGALGQAGAWRLSRVLEKPSGLHDVDQDLNRHLLAFQVVDERGRWVVRRADFDATPVASLAGDDILEASERYSPGQRYLKNLTAVYFGGAGSDESAYRALALEIDEASGKRSKEFAVDKLLSQFIPLSADPRNPGDIPLAVARARLRLQHYGLRTLDFSTRLESAWLQIGDHVHLESRRYRRAGAGSPNPLLVLLTRKSIDPDLKAVHWSGLVLCDNGEDAPAALEPQPPSGLSVTPNGDGTVAWSWSASPQDDGVQLLRYELYRRQAHLDGWGAPVATLSATGAAAYTLEEGPYEKLMRYDYGLRAVNLAGRASRLLSLENVDVTASPPAPPGPEDWSLETREGGIALYVLHDSGPAQYYNIHVLLDGATWRSSGRIARGDRGAFIFWPQDPTSVVTVRIFCLSAVDSYGQEGAWSEPKGQVFRRLTPASEVLPPPVWDSAGGVYPLTSWVDTGPYQGFSISLRLAAPAGAEDLAARYEVQRASDGGSGGSVWSEWERLPDCALRDPGESPLGPSSVVYENRDSSFKPTWRYRYRVRAIGRNNVPGGWSGTQTVLLTEDTTAPDRPVLSVGAQTGANALTISAPTIAGGPCPDFAFWKIEGFCQQSGQWTLLETEWRGTAYIHAVGDNELEKDWKYRATAYDHSGNASPVSLETGYARMKRAGTAFLASTVNDTLAQVTLNQADIELKVDSYGVISAINLSPEGVDISGAKITLDGDSVFGDDCEIYGQLKLCRTSQNLERIEIGTYSTGEEIRCYGTIGGETEHLGIRIYTFDFDQNELPVIKLQGSDIFSVGSDPGWVLTGWGLIPEGYAGLGLPDAAESGNWPLRSTCACLGWDYAALRLHINDNDTLYTFCPRERDYDLAAGKVYRIDGTQVLGAPQAAVADASCSGVPQALSECARATEFDSLADRFNSLLARLRSHGLIST